MRDEDCVSLLQWALPRLGLRWPGFRKVRRQVCKRVSRRCVTLGLADGVAYRAYLQAHEEEWRQMDDFCRISISRFWRDHGVFDAIAATLLPRLAAGAVANGRRVVDVWSAGCASGEEPYSLAMAWRMAAAGTTPQVGLRIVASDADSVLLERARRGVYSGPSLRHLPAGWRERAFAAVDAGFRLGESYRDGIEFALQDIRTAMPDGPFDLVMCRNLAFTYFAEDGQRQTLSWIVARLRVGGALIVGRHEVLPADGWPLAASPEIPGAYIRLP